MVNKKLPEGIGHVDVEWFPSFEGESVLIIGFFGNLLSKTFHVII
jgi:hypothetical protein